MMNNIFTLAASPIGLEFDNFESFYEFENKFHNWIHSSEQKMVGLPENRFIVSGLTDAFNQTYGLYKKIGIFPGEYGYHYLTLKDRITLDFAEADIIILSHPFSADGMSSHDKLAIANKYNKPIFVDCAFFGICQNIDFDFTPYKNIVSVCFSLSKTYGTGRRRVGLLYTTDRYPVSVYKEWHYPLLSSAEYHYKLIDTLTPDSVSMQYKAKQLEICKKYNLVPSDTIIFGLDYENRYPAYKRGNVNRLGLSKLLKNV